MRGAKTTRKASPPAAGAGKEPHELFWEAGQRFYQALQKQDEETRDKLASAQQRLQQALWEAQLDAQKRAEELRHEWEASPEAVQRYLDGVGEVQAKAQQEWEAANAGYQKAAAKLQEAFQLSRLMVFRDYKHACQKAWARLDPDALSCESLATIGQSFLIGAQLMGGKPYGS